MKRKYLLKPDREDLRDKLWHSSLFKTAASLPKQVDLRPGCSPVVDQGELGSCTANAIASGLREFLLLKAGKSLVRLSRLFLYYEERLLEGDVSEDSGAEIRDGMKVLSQMGICPESEDPYNVKKFTNPPTAQEIRDALPYRIGAYHRVFGLIGLKTALAEGLPVVIGIDVYENFESKAVAKTGIVPIPKGNEQCLGGHAVCVVGYDDAKNWLIVRNSWGANWGDKGYFYLPYKYHDLVSDMWTGQ